jgi:GTPase involved in cell partitioning and DNA repair
MGTVEGEYKIKITDLDENGARFRAAKGGQGGTGNFKNK